MASKNLRQTFQHWYWQQHSELEHRQLSEHRWSVSTDITLVDMSFLISRAIVNSTSRDNLLICEEHVEGWSLETAMCCENASDNWWEESSKQRFARQTNILVSHSNVLFFVCVLSKSHILAVNVELFDESRLNFLIWFTQRQTELALMMGSIKSAAIPATVSFLFHEYHFNPCELHSVEFSS